VITTPYRHPRRFQDEIEKTIKELLAMGHIKPRSSPFASSVVLVLKKDCTMRLYIDYHALNKKTIKNRYPIPHIDELMDKLHGVVFFSKIDLHFRYHQIIIREKDIEKMAFRCHYGHFEFRPYTHLLSVEKSPTHLVCPWRHKPKSKPTVTSIWTSSV
jgi:hypothetical protein